MASVVIFAIVILPALTTSTSGLCKKIRQKISSDNVIFLVSLPQVSISAYKFFGLVNESSSIG
jgi:hypothetical protein